MREMSRTIFVLILSALSLPSFSQSKGIKCTYISSMTVTKGFLELEEPARSVITERIKSDHKVYSLTIAGGRSLFVKEPESVDKMPLTVDVRQVFMNLSDSTHVAQSMYLNKLYVVSDRMKPMAWNMESAKEEVLGYSCYKATLVNENGLNTAWFTTEVPINHAPLGFNGLPGLVVRMTTPVYTLDLKNITEVSDASIEAPKEGISITDEDFDNLRKGNFQEFIKDKPVKVIK